MTQTRIPDKEPKMSPEDIEKLKDFGSYRGAIERTRIPKMLFVESGDNGETVYIVGRRNASAIVRALHEAGYEIVRRS
jgi:hypothetical protein